MTAGYYAMRLRRNAAESLRLILEDAEGPIDITGHTFELEVRLYPGQPGEPLLRLTTVDYISLDDPVNGSLEINWPAVLAAIDALPTFAEAGDPTAARVDTFSYDLLMTSPSGVPQAILEGPVPVSYGVTR
jgi:hypothetical protein